jgi:hypothetical protein
MVSAPLDAACYYRVDRHDLAGAVACGIFVIHAHARTHTSIYTHAHRDTISQVVVYL